MQYLTNADGHNKYCCYLPYIKDFCCFLFNTYFLQAIYATTICQSSVTVICIITVIIWPSCCVSLFFVRDWIMVAIRAHLLSTHDAEEGKNAALSLHTHTHACAYTHTHLHIDTHVKLFVAIYLGFKKYQSWWSWIKIVISSDSLLLWQDGHGSLWHIADKTNYLLLTCICHICCI